jgi:hypothetical protein
MGAELDAKRLELLRTAFPQITAVSALVDPSNPPQLLMLERIEQAAHSMGLERVVRVEAPTFEALRALHPAVFSGARAKCCRKRDVLELPPGHHRGYQRGAPARDLS